MNRKSTEIPFFGHLHDCAVKGGHKCSGHCQLEKFSQKVKPEYLEEMLIQRYEEHKRWHLSFSAAQMEKELCDKKKDLEIREKYRECKTEAELAVKVDDLVKSVSFWKDKAVRALAALKERKHVL